MSPTFRKVLVGLILLWTLGFGLFMANRDSATTDEDIHVSSAYLALTRHDFRFDPEHPFLFRYLTALPLFALTLNPPEQDQAIWKSAEPTVYDSWREARSWADQWFFNSGNNGNLMIFLSRIPGVLVLVGLCWLVYYLASRWFSEKIGLYALIFTAFNPTVIAHGHFTNNDIASAFTFLLTIGALYVYYQKTSWKQAVWLGLAFAIAITTKFSMIVLVPIVGIWMIYTAIKKSYFKGLLAHLGIVILVTWIFIWLVYLGPITLVDGTIFTIKGSRILPSQIWEYQDLFEKVILLRYVLPVDFIKGLALVIGGSRSGRTSYFMGEVTRGTFKYFPLLFLLKTPLSGLFLLVTGFGIFLAKPFRKQWQPITYLLLLAAGVYTAASLLNKINLGIRHILPLLPLASIAMALCLDLLIKKTSQKWLSPVFLPLYVIPVLASYPVFLGYTNAAIRPPQDAHIYFNDSNLDWGQQAKDIVNVVNEKYGNETIYSNYPWNPYILDYYRLRTKPFEALTPPQDGIIIVTATQLSYPDYGVFRSLEPVSTISNNTFFYRIPAQ